MHPIRLQTLNDASIDTSKPYILYWMTSARRPQFNFALEHAIELANEHNIGLVVFEGLRMEYRWASDRFHQFVQDGMIVNQALPFRTVKPTIFPAWKHHKTPIKEILWALIGQAAAVVTDYYPAFFLPKMTRLAAAKCPVQFQQVDGNGVYPIWATDRYYTTAHSFRRHIQKTIAPYLQDFPVEQPLNRLQNSYTPTIQHFSEQMLKLFNQQISEVDLSTLSIDHSVGPISDRKGGYVEARKRLVDFMNKGLKHMM